MLTNNYLNNHTLYAKVLTGELCGSLALLLTQLIVISR